MQPWKLLHHAKQSATDVFKASSERVIQKIVKVNSDLIGNKIDNKVIKS